MVVAAGKSQRIEGAQNLTEIIKYWNTDETGKMDLRG
jgi:hypothetical protein